jgi:predicted nuclease of restriction endonuclease-like (RecB) superfamily
VPNRNKQERLTSVDVGEAPLAGNYGDVLGELVGLIDSARCATVRSVDAIMVATYFLVGRAIVEQEQKAAARAANGERLLERLGADLSARFGRGFSPLNLSTMRLFYLAYAREILRRLSKKSGLQTGSGRSELLALASRFQLPWSQYVLLVRRSRTNKARAFYETETLRGGWTIRQLERQMDTLFYERTVLSRNKTAVLANEAKAGPSDTVTGERELKNPLLLQVVGLNDEYSESDLEEALILRVEHFLLGLGDFTFVGRQRRLRVGDAWYRVDLLFFHRRLRCVIVVDLKLGELTHADDRQMHLYLNYAREHWTHEHENPPAGLILCTKGDAALAKYALEGLSNKTLASEYVVVLPDEGVLVDELARARADLEARPPAGKDHPEGAVDVRSRGRRSIRGTRPRSC